MKLVMTQMLAWADKEYKTTMVNTFKNMKQNVGLMSKHMGYLSTEMGTIKKSLMDILELQST